MNDDEEILFTQTDVDIILSGAFMALVMYAHSAGSLEALEDLPSYHPVLHKLCSRFDTTEEHIYSLLEARY